MNTSLYQRAGALLSAAFVTCACSHSASEAPAKTPSEGARQTSTTAPPGPAQGAESAPVGAERGTAEAPTVGAERGTAGGATEPSVGDQVTYGFDCDNHRSVVAVIDDDFAYLVSEGYVALPRVEVDDPEAKSEGLQTYELGSQRLWLTGAHAIMSLADGSRLECTRDPVASAWADAQLRGVTFRALGSEPRFVVEVGPEAVTVVTDDDTQTYSILKPEPERVGDRTVYRGGTNGDGLVATIEPGACSVGDQSFQNRVRVEAGDRTYEGCGRAIEAPKASVATVIRMPALGVPALGAE